jgi:hypothetical protein
MISTNVQESKFLPTVIRTLAVLFVVFFSLALVAAATKSQAPGLLDDLFGWGSIGDAEEMMISAIYIVWGLFLWPTAKDPARYRFFLDFTIAANAAHFGVMLVQAIVIEGEHLHLAGDVLVGWAVLLALVVAWLPVRRQAA